MQRLLLPRSGRLARCPGQLPLPSNISKQITLKSKLIAFRSVRTEKVKRGYVSTKSRAGLKVLPGHATLQVFPFVRRPTRQEFGPIAVISVFLGGLNFGLFYVGMGLGSGSMSAVAYQLTTPFTILLAWPLLAERPSLIASTGVLLAFGGVVVLAAGPGLSANVSSS
jgi:drug/metabolite transporter (DMT)-like permease